MHGEIKAESYSNHNLVCVRTYRVVAGGLDADVERGGRRREEGRADKGAGDHREPPGTAALHRPPTARWHALALSGLVCRDGTARPAVPGEERLSRGGELVSLNCSCGAGLRQWLARPGGGQK
jgi:hypothetical protein